MSASGTGLDAIADVCSVKLACDVLFSTEGEVASGADDVNDVAAIVFVGCARFAAAMSGLGEEARSTSPLSRLTSATVAKTDNKSSKPVIPTVSNLLVVMRLADCRAPSGT